MGVYIDNVGGVISIGSFEHYCSIEEYIAGKQEEIYRKYFRYCYERLGRQKGKRMYLQTMSFPEKYPNVERVLNGNKEPIDSQYRHLYYLTFLYPGSWLPKGYEQIKQCASPYFEVIDHSKGQYDYINTMKLWGVEARKMLKKHPLFRAKIFLKGLFNPFFRNQLHSFWQKSNQRCFEQGWMHHERIVFEVK